MASTQTFSEGNGASAGTETASRAEMNWKNIDDSTTAYSSSVISAGNNSFWKYQALVFAGTWNSLSALTVAVDNNAPATGLSIVGGPKSSAVTPAATASGDTSFSTGGTAVNFTGVNWAAAFAAGTSSSTAGGTLYTQPIRTQLQTTGSAAPGDIATRTFTYSWTES
jgi:hypothetical protein